MNKVMLDIVALFACLIALSCGVVYAYLYVFDGFTPVGDRLGGVALTTAGIAYLLSFCRN